MCYILLNCEEIEIHIQNNIPNLITFMAILQLNSRVTNNYILLLTFWYDKN